MANAQNPLDSFIEDTYPDAEPDPHQVLIDLCGLLSEYAEANGTTLLRALSDHQDSRRHAA